MASGRITIRLGVRLVVRDGTSQFPCTTDGKGRSGCATSPMQANSIPGCQVGEEMLKADVDFSEPSTIARNNFGGEAALEARGLWN